ncbi:MAG TPA: hypothetical protein VHS05_26500 [Pyrinomonadaceae bacterium]|jgi:hypothetical protein|nr:hypothetical protein [Pyrinomonadaceae bacterium]
MKGLRVYLDLTDPEGRGFIFYSQREGGPYYRWRYEELRGEWLCSRMRAGDLIVTELVSAPWKEIPAALKTTFDQHYVE